MTLARTLLSQCPTAPRTYATTRRTPSHYTQQLTSQRRPLKRQLTRSGPALGVHAFQKVSMMASSDQGSVGVEKKSVLFVCLGNICRSPTAEAVFKSIVEQRGMTDHFIIDSCGTGGGNPHWYQDGGWSYHEGDPSDERMTQAAERRGIVLTSKSRPLRIKDLTEVDLFVAMDASNVEEMKRAIRHWAQKDASLNEARDRIVLMTDFCQNEAFKARGEVPDPYYGGKKGFETVLDLLTDACDGLLTYLTNGVVQSS